MDNSTSEGAIVARPRAKRDPGRDFSWLPFAAFESRRAHFRSQLSEYRLASSMPVTAAKIFFFDHAIRTIGCAGVSKKMVVKVVHHCRREAGISIGHPSHQGRPAAVLEEIVMKLHSVAIAIVFAGMAGAAAAGNSQVLPRISVSGVDLAACTPPADARACDNFHSLIRANFSDREIGMLFGDRTSYPEYLSGGYDRVRQRYLVLVQEYVAALPPASVEIAGR